jgi:hypothetical protein
MRALRQIERSCVRGADGDDRAAPSVRPLPLRASGRDPRGEVRDRAGAGRGLEWQAARRGRRRLGRTRWAGRFRIFRYEIRLWRNGHIPDVIEAVESPRRLASDQHRARRVLDVVAQVPTPVWGRDEFGTGEMWNSNSVMAWVLARSGIHAESIRPPAGGGRPAGKPDSKSRTGKSTRHGTPVPTASPAAPRTPDRPARLG